MIILSPSWTHYGKKIFYITVVIDQKVQVTNLSNLINDITFTSFTMYNSLKEFKKY